MRAIILSLSLVVLCAIWYCAGKSSLKHHPYFSDDRHKVEDCWLRLPVVDPWKGKITKYGCEGKTVGYLYIKTTSKTEEYQIHFCPIGEETHYSGIMAWEILADAMRDNHKPLLQVEK